MSADEAGLDELLAQACELGADPNAQAADGQTPLHLAAGYCAAGLVDYFLEQTPVDLELTDRTGQTAEQRIDPDGGQQLLKMFAEKRHFPRELQAYRLAASGARLPTEISGMVEAESDHGHGWFAAEPLAPGRLVLRESALQTSESQPELIAGITRMASSGSAAEQAAIESMCPRGDAEMIGESALAGLYAWNREGTSAGQDATATDPVLLEKCARNWFCFEPPPAAGVTGAAPGGGSRILRERGGTSCRRAIFARAAIFNHSCRPNCVWMVTGEVGGRGCGPETTFHA